MRRLALLVLALAGCGGSGPSIDEFTAEANRVCRDGEASVARIVEEERERIEREGGDTDPEQAAADVLERATEEYEPYMDRLRAVEAPDDLKDDWDAFLDRIEEAFGLFPRLAEATRSGDREELTELTTRFARIAGDTRPFAQRHGLDDCLPEGGQL
jgi:hypothetical protein